MRRLPTAVKARRGTLRPDRMNPREPRPELGVPKPRRGLPADVRATYRRLAAILKPLHVVTLADGPALELLAGAIAEHDRAAAVIGAVGATYECPTSVGAVLHRVRPEVALAADAWRRAAVLLAGFGLTPASRSKVEAQPDRLSDLLGLNGGQHA
jgi:P27 family predicted phage terminase small subunit